MSRAKRVKFLKGKHLPGMEVHWVLQTQSRTGPMLCRCPTQKGLCGVLFCFVWGGGVCFIEKWTWNWVGWEKLGDGKVTKTYHVKKSKKRWLRYAQLSDWFTCMWLGELTNLGRGRFLRKDLRYQSIKYRKEKKKSALSWEWWLRPLILPLERPSKEECAYIWGHARLHSNF